MSSNTYKRIEIVGTSSEGLQQAIESGIERASQSVRHIDWFEVTEIRGHVAEGKVAHYQVSMKLGFRLED